MLMACFQASRQIKYLEEIALKKIFVTTCADITIRKKYIACNRNILRMWKPLLNYSPGSFLLVEILFYCT